MKARIEISSGLEVSIKILSLLKKRKDLKANVHIGTFTNCRELGYTYTITDGFIGKEKVFLPIEEWFTFCTYEHRNSDEIIINGKKGYVSNNGDLPYNGDSKYDYLASFRYDDFDGAVDKLVELMNEKINNYAKK